MPPIPPPRPATPWFSWGAASLVLLIAAGTALRLYQLDGFSLWEDELFSVATASQSGPWYGPLVTGKNMEQLQLADSFWTWKFADPHPPLYELLLALWIKLFGLSDFAIRSLSAVLGVGAMLSVFALPRSVGWLARAVYTLLMASAGMLLVYSQDARNYMLGAFLSAWMLVLLIRQHGHDPASLRAGRPGVLLLVAASLLCLTHYYGVLMAVAVAASAMRVVREPAALLRGALRWAATFVPVGGYILLGWTGIATKLDAAPQKGLSWGMAFKRNVLALLKNVDPAAGSTQFWIFMLLALAALLIHRRLRIQRQPLQAAVGTTVCVLAVFSLLLAMGTRRVEFFSPRYMIFMVPGCLLLVALCAQVRGWPRVLSLLLAAFLVPAGLQDWLRSPRPQNGGDWRGAAEQVARAYQPGDVVVFPLQDPTMRAHFQHYLRKHIPSEQLQTHLFSITDAGTLPGLIAQLPARPPKVIVFTHWVFTPRALATVEVLQTQLGCTAQDWQQVQSLRYSVLHCPT